MDARLKSPLLCLDKLLSATGVRHTEVRQDRLYQSLPSRYYNVFLCHSPFSKLMSCTTILCHNIKQGFSATSLVTLFGNSSRKHHIVLKKIFLTYKSDFQSEVSPLKFTDFFSHAFRKMLSTSFLWLIFCHLIHRNGLWNIRQRPMQ